MAIIVLQHGPLDGLGRLGPILRDNAHRLEICRLDIPAGRAGARGVPVDFDGVSGVISLGGHQNVGEDHPWMAAELAFLKEAHARQLPLIGVCLGAQLIAAALGGEVGPAATPEFGFCRVVQTPPGNTDVILAGQPWTSWQFQAHGQEIKKAPEGATVLASSPVCKVQCFRAGLRTYGFQYHFEATRADVEQFCRDAWCKSVMQQLKLSDADMAGQVERHYAEFDRLGDRLAKNIESFMFPALTRARG